jgi:hypothetical protein
MTQFARIPAHAASVRGLSGRDWQILTCIALHADKEGGAFPSLSRISKITNIDRRHIPRSIARIEAVGLLRHHPRKSDTGAWANSVYEIVFDTPAEAGLTNGVASFEMSSGGITTAESGFPHDAPTITKEASNKKSRQVAEDMLAVWRTECGDVLPIPQSLDRDRVNACYARFRDSFDGDLRRWQALCREIRLSAFCCGKGASGWRADFDWALKPKSIRNVIEGKYRNARPPQFRGTGTYGGVPPLGPGGT